VRDASAAAALGIPTAVVHLAGVSGIAEATRCVTGLGGAALVEIPTRLFGLTREQIEDATRPRAPQVVAALGIRS
jgi:hypothetical protein